MRMSDWSSDVCSSYLAWAMFPALAIPAGSPLPTDDADALYRGVCYRAQAGARLPPGAAEQVSWPQAAATEPRMFVSIPSRQRHQLRWATPTLVAVLWLAFLWASPRPGGQQRALLLELGALRGGQLAARTAARRGGKEWFC